MPSYRRSTKSARTSSRRRSYARSRVTKRTRAFRRVKRVPRPLSLQRSVWKNPMARTGTYVFTYNDLSFGTGLTAAGSYVGDYVFRANSLYDPDQSGVGVQPYGYDNLMGATGTGMFDKYKVYAAKITVYFQRLVTNPSTANTTSALRLAIVPYYYNSLSYTEFNDVSRIPGTRTNLIRTSDDSSKQKLSLYTKIRSVFPMGTNPVDMYASYDANPGFVAHFHVFWDGSTSLTADSTVNYDVKIKYYAKLWKTGMLNES